MARRRREARSRRAARNTPTARLLPLQVRVVHVRILLLFDERVDLALRFFELLFQGLLLLFCQIQLLVEVLLREEEAVTVKSRR